MNISENFYPTLTARKQRICYLVFLLCIITLLLLFSQRRVFAKDEEPLTGTWVGVYALADEPVVFFVDWDEGENGRFQRNQAPRAQPITNLQNNTSHVQFSADDLTFDGDWFAGALVGIVEGEGENGRFYLAPLAQPTTESFASVIGSYDLELSDPIIISRGDALTQLFYQQGNHQARLYPAGDNQFLTALGDQFIIQSGQLHITDMLTPAPKNSQVGQLTNTYQEEDVTFANGEVQLSGTLFLPTTAEPVPAIILLHGSGAAERHFYRIFADLFARHGVAALIYDKRGHGASSGQPETITLQALADDAQAGIQFLAQHEQIDPKQIGVWGFSQGGRILPMAAAQNEDVAFAIAVSAPGMSGNTLNLWRQDIQQAEAGVSELARTFALKMNQLPWCNADADGSIDPTDYWQQVQQPTLLLYGDADQVVPPGDSAAAILAALAQANPTAVSFKLFSGANHDIMIQETAISRASVPTYAPGYFDTMISWIQNGFPAQTTSPTLRQTGEFSGNGRYAPAPWYRQTWFQLPLILLIVGGVVTTAVFIVNRYRHKR